MKLDMAILNRALNSYENALNFASDRLSESVTDIEKNVIKAGVIQNFEFTYELS